MKARIRHNLSDSQFESLVKSLNKQVGAKKPRPRLPADNPAQAKLSESLLRDYKKIMVQSLGNAIKEALEKESPDE
tara:strand:+ start:450 stop:677 length:228 start_codon:yes stop_codon:yes gene_type:complete